MWTADMHSAAVALEFGLAALTFVMLLWIYAPYGRGIRPGWGPVISSRVGWIVMESPPVVVFAAIFFAGSQSGELVPLVFFGLWQLHYVHRAYVYPLRMRLHKKKMPVVIMLSAVGFNLLNAYVNAAWIGHFGRYGPEWLATPQFIGGLALFVLGASINFHSDEVLRTLRAPGETGYRIPNRGLHRWVAAPNYFGEILEWTGWAIMLQAPAGWAFAVYAFANLAPRAWSHRAWYRETFADYPPGRRALVPFVL